MIATENRIEVNATERGTIIHKLMEFNLKEEIGVYDCKEESNKADYEYSQIEQKVTEEMINVADNATQQVLDIYDWYRRGDPTAYMVSEGYVHWVTGKGVPDVYIVTRNYVHIIDLKTGNNYSVNNPEDKIYRGYSAGILRQSKKEKREIRVTVINGFEYKTIDEPYTSEQINYWHKEQQRQLDYKALTKREPDSLPTEINKLEQVVIDVIKNNPELITTGLLDAIDSISKVKALLFNAAKEQVLEGKVKYEGYELKSKTKEDNKEELLIDYLVEKIGIEREVFGAFKAHRGNIRDNFDAETNQWVEENEIFGSKDVPGFNFSKKK